LVRQGRTRTDANAVAGPGLTNGPPLTLEQLRYRALYHQRGAVEHEFGRLKHEWALLPLRVRRIERVRLHADLSILGRLMVALDKAHGKQETHSVSGGIAAA
jgi:Transposase DDE domain